MPETALIYAVESVATDGSPILEIWRRPALVDLTYAKVKTWGVIATGQKPDFVWFRGDLYLIGGYSRVLVRHKQETRWRPAGVRAPDAAVSTVEGAGSGGSPGQCIAYQTFVHKQGARLLAESNPSIVSELPNQTGKGYDWTFQTSGYEERVTHVRGYRSMNGGPYRLALEVPIGTTTYFENVKTNQLLQTGPSGHYIPPFGLSFAAKAFGRMWYARTQEYPHRLWGSQPGQPQYIPLTNFRDTDDREAITGLAKSRDVLIVFCLNSTYILRKHGSGAFDFTLQKLDSAVGCVSHWGIREIHNKLWFPGTDGVWVYDGGFRFAMADIRDFYRADYEANREPFKRGFSIDDKTGKNYVFYIPRPGAPAFAREDSVGTVSYVGNYVNFEPSLGGQNPEPDWSLDLYGRLHTAAVYSEIGEVIIASEDAKIRKFDEDNDDDDGDALQKHLVILTGHQLFMKPGDDINSAKTFKPWYAHMESEFNAWTVGLYGGDEAAARGIDIDNLNTWWQNSVPASEQWATVGTPPALAKFVPKSVHFMVPEKVSGRGLSALFQAVLTKGMSYRGYGGWYLPGPATRGPEILGSAVGGDFTVVPQYENVWTDLPTSKLSFQGLEYNLRLDITAGNAVEPAWIVMEITKPSGAKEAFPYRVDEGDWTIPYQTPGDLVTLEIGENIVTGYVLDSQEQSGSGTSTFEIIEDAGITGPTVYVECNDDPGVPEEGATVDLYIDQGSGMNFYEQKVTDVNGLVSWALIPSDTVEIRVEGNSGCGSDEQTTDDWSSQIDLSLEGEGG